MKNNISKCECPAYIIESSQACEMLMQSGHFDQAILCAQNLLDLIESEGLVCDPPDILFRYYRDQRDMASPTIYMTYIHRLLHYAEKNQLMATLCHATYYKAYVFYMARQAEDAKLWFEKSLVLALDYGDFRLQAMSLSNLGNLCYLKEDHDQAKNFYLRAMHLVDQYHIDDLKYSRHNLGLIALKKGEYDLALHYMEEALEYATLSNDRNLMANSYSDIAEVYFAKGDLDHALQLFKHTLNFEGDFITSINLRDTYMSISKVYKELGDHALAYDYLLRFTDLYIQFSQKQEKDNLARLEQTYILQHYENERLLNEELTTSLQDLQNTQAQLIQTEKRVALNRMVSSIAHHLNTPLGNAISTLSYLQQEHYAPGMELIASSLDRMQAFIALMTESTISSDHLDIASIHIADFLKAIARQYFDHHTLQLKVTGPNIEILTYAPLIERVFLELFTNSIKHSGLPLPILVSVNINISEPLHQLAIEIGDSGKGISADMIESAFDPFVTANMAKYNGMGLYVARQIVVDLLGGQLEIISDKNDDTYTSRFVLTLNY